MNASSLTQDLKDEARRLGFALAGVCPAVTPTGLHRFYEWLEAGYAGEMQYLHERRDAYQHPRPVLAGTVLGGPVLDGTVLGGPVVGRLAGAGAAGTVGAGSGSAGPGSRSLITRSGRYWSRCTVRM